MNFNTNLYYTQNTQFITILSIPMIGTNLLDPHIGRPPSQMHTIRGSFGPHLR